MNSGIQNSLKASFIKNDSRRGSIVSFHTDNSPLTSIEDEENDMDQINEEDEKEDKREEECKFQHKEEKSETLKYLANNDLKPCLQVGFKPIEEQKSEEITKENGDISVSMLSDQEEKSAQFSINQESLKKMPIAKKEQNEENLCGFKKSIDQSAIFMKNQCSKIYKFSVNFTKYTKN